MNFILSTSHFTIEIIVDYDKMVFVIETYRNVVFFIVEYTSIDYINSKRLVVC